jgi:tripartite-type tricarboxylate transporter receptor subunit TctC
MSAKRLAVALGLFSPSLAQDGPYPSHTMRLLVSSAPGGNRDILGRLLAERMSRDFGQAVLVENVQGAETAMVGLTIAKAARRVEMAARYLPVEQLAVSPQCGFRSSIGIPQLSEDTEWRKFELLIKTAEAVWGHV